MDNNLLLENYVFRNFAKRPINFCHRIWLTCYRKLFRNFNENIYHSYVQSSKMQSNFYPTLYPYHIVKKEIFVSFI